MLCYQDFIILGLTNVGYFLQLRKDVGKNLSKLFYGDQRGPVAVLFERGVLVVATLVFRLQFP